MAYDFYEWMVSICTVQLWLTVFLFLLLSAFQGKLEKGRGIKWIHWNCFEPEVCNDFLDRYFFYFLIKGSKILVSKQPLLASVALANTNKPSYAIWDVFVLSAEV